MKGVDYPMTIGIYAFHLKDKIVYIGKSINIEKRIQRHLQELRKGSHCNSHFQRAFNKYGESAFNTSILEVCEEEALNEKEIYFIDKYNMLSLGFNQNKGGDGGARVFGVNYIHNDDLVISIAKLLSDGEETNSIAEKVFGEEYSKSNLDYIGRIRRREIRSDLTKDYIWDERKNSRRQISDEVIKNICEKFEMGLSNKEISLEVFGEWNSTRWNYLIKLRNRKSRTNITKNYNW